MAENQVWWYILFNLLSARTYITEPTVGQNIRDGCGGGGIVKWRALSAPSGVKCAVKIWGRQRGGKCPPAPSALHNDFQLTLISGHFESNKSFRNRFMKTYIPLKKDIITHIAFYSNLKNSHDLKSFILFNPLPKKITNPEYFNKSTISMFCKQTSWNITELYVLTIFK